MEKLSARNSALRWAASLLLFLPVIALYACEYLRPDGRTFTGFIQYDQPSYMSDARAFFDDGFHLFYGNPFSPDPNTPRIYFQIHLLLLGFVQKVMGWDPGVVYVLFGFVAGLVCVRVAMALYEEVAGLRSPAQWLGLVLFIWGGGILALMGLAYHVVAGHAGRQLFDDVFSFDPAAGWWFLNLGRNLVFPTEAYYHALALGLILAALRRNFRAAIALGFLLLLSHPFTGLQFLLIVTVWAGVESVVLKNREVPFLFAATIGCLVLAHLLYYAVLLNLFPEHRVVAAQWTIGWNVSALTALGADFLVGLLALWAMRSWSLTRELLMHPESRLLATWFLVSLALSHHDLFLPARQPIHFARGYTWAALFLLGARPLMRLLETAVTQTAVLSRVGALAVILGIGLSDNMAWFGSQACMALSPGWNGVWYPGRSFAFDASDRELFRWMMQRPEPHAELVVDTDPDSTIPYLATAYTDYCGWWTHFATTPYSNDRKREVAEFVHSGKVAPGWKGRSLLIISSLQTSQSSEEASWGEPIYQKSGLSRVPNRFSVISDEIFR